MVVTTDRNRAGVEETVRLIEDEGAEALANMRRAALTGDVNSTQDVANAVIWLCSEASRQITGTTLAIDGGLLKR